MPDFDTIAEGLNNHFCPNCGCSFECDYEEGSCNCPGTEYSFDPPWCDECVEAQQIQEAEAEAQGNEDEEDDDEPDPNSD